MPRNVLKSNNSIMLITESPSFSTETKTGILFGGVTSTDFSFDLDRLSAKLRKRKFFTSVYRKENRLHKASCYR